MPVKPDPRHADAAELEIDVWTLRDRGDAIPPRREHLVVAVGVGTDPRQSAEMVQDDRQIGDSFGKCRQLGELREAHAYVERKTHSRQHPSACPVVGAGEHPLLFPVLDLRVRVPGDRMADATKAVGAGGP